MSSDDADERRLHVAWVLTRSIAVLRGLVPVMIGLAVGLGGWAGPAIAVVAVGVIALRVLEWRTTRYAVVDGGIRLRSGVLNRRERVVPASRISAIDTRRGIVQRAFGLVALDVQTPGGGKQAELTLSAVTLEEAERLRRELGHAEAAGQGAGRSGGPSPVGSDAVPGGTGRPVPAPVAAVYEVTGRDLVVAALTGPQLGLAAVLAGSLLQFDDVIPGGVTDRVGDEVSGADTVTLVVLVIVALLAAVAVAVAATVLAFAEFRVERDDRRLRIRRGLLTERTGTIPLDRVLGVRIVEGLLRRPLGYATVRLEVAAYRGDDDLVTTVVPLARRRDLPELLARMLPEVPWTDEPLHRAPSRARRRYWTVPVLLGLIAAAVAVLVLPDDWRLLAALPPVVGLLLGDARWRGAGWALGPDTLTVRSQLVARTTLVVLARRVQHVAVSAHPLQRRVGLATFDVVLATGHHGELRHVDAPDADHLQREVAARSTRRPPPAIARDGSLSFAAPPE